MLIPGSDREKEYLEYLLKKHGKKKKNDRREISLRSADEYG